VKIDFDEIVGFGDPVFSLGFRFGGAFEIAESAQFLGQFFEPHADADVKEVTVRINFGRKNPFPSLELFRDGILETLQVPRPENQTAGGNNQNNN
jgi:hypothetical protein